MKLPQVADEAGSPQVWRVLEQAGADNDSPSHVTEILYRDSGWTLVAKSFERDNEPMGFLKGGTFLEQLNNS
jgi:hypothetical protein